MNLNIVTEFKKNKKTVDNLAVTLDLEALSGIVKAKGLEAGNKALDKFVSKFTTDLKKKLSGIINS